MPIQRLESAVINCIKHAVLLLGLEESIRADVLFVSQHCPSNLGRNLALLRTLLVLVWQEIKLTRQAMCS